MRSDHPYFHSIYIYITLLEQEDDIYSLSDITILNNSQSNFKSLDKIIIECCPFLRCLMTAAQIAKVLK